MRTERQILSKRKRLITQYNKLNAKRPFGREDELTWHLVVGELISINWILNKKNKK